MTKKLNDPEWVQKMVDHAVEQIKKQSSRAEVMIADLRPDESVLGEGRSHQRKIIDALTEGARLISVENEIKETSDGEFVRRELTGRFTITMEREK